MVWVLLTGLVLGAGAPTPSSACGETDLPCLRRKLQESFESLILTTRELAFQQRLSQNLEQQNESLRASVAALSGAAQAVIAQPLTAHWYQSPVLWTVVGLTLGIVLTAVAGLVVGQIAAGLAAQAASR